MEELARALRLAMRSPDTPENVEWKSTLEVKAGTGGGGIAGTLWTPEGDEGLVVALVSVTGIVDEVHDVIEPGAYADTLRTRIPKGVWSHDWVKWASRTEAIEEFLPGDARLPAQTRNGDPWPTDAGGLVVATRFNLNTQVGYESYANVRFFDEGPLGPQVEWSIGYQVPAGASYKNDGNRHIRRLLCFEYSPVLFGAAPLAGVLATDERLAAAAA